MQHSPWLAQLVDVELVDCAVVFCPASGDGERDQEIVLRVASLRAGLSVTFDALAAATATAPALGKASTLAPTSALSFAPGPLLSPYPASPHPFAPIPLTRPLSPFTESRSLLAPTPPPYSPSPDTEAATTSDDAFRLAYAHRPGAVRGASEVGPAGKPAAPASPRAGRIRQARARASRLSSVMSSRAGRVWARALGKARGSASVRVALSGVVVYRAGVTPGDGGSRSGTQTPTEAKGGESEPLTGGSPATTRKRSASSASATATASFSPSGTDGPNPSPLAFLRKRRPTAASSPRWVLAEAPGSAHATLTAAFGGVTMYGDDDSVALQASVERVAVWSERWLQLREAGGWARGRAEGERERARPVEGRSRGVFKAVSVRRRSTFSETIGI